MKIERNDSLIMAPSSSKLTVGLVNLVAMLMRSCAELRRWLSSTEIALRSFLLKTLCLSMFKIRKVKQLKGNTKEW